MNEINALRQTKDFLCRWSLERVRADLKPHQLALFLTCYASNLDSFPVYGGEASGLVRFGLAVRQGRPSAIGVTSKGGALLEKLFAALEREQQVIVIQCVRKLTEALSNVKSVRHLAVLLICLLEDGPHTTRTLASKLALRKQIVADALALFTEWGWVHRCVHETNLVVVCYSSANNQELLEKIKRCAR